MAHHNHARHLHRRDRVGNAHQEVRRQDTVVSVVYVTASPTFTGKIGGYKTMDGSEDDLPNPQPIPTPEPTTAVSRASPAVLAQSTPVEVQEPITSTATTPVAQISQQRETTPTEEAAKPSSIASEVETSEAAASKAVTSSTLSTKPTTRKGDQSSSKTLSDTLVPTHQTESSVPLLGATSTAAVASSIDAQSAATTSTAASTDATESSGGMSGGAKAGLAIGILLAIGALAALIFFCLRRRKTRRNEAYSKTSDEKAALQNEGAATGGLQRSASVQTATTSRTAPRLSLRPVTQFLPDLAAQRKSGGNLLAVAGGPARHNDPAAKEADVEKAATRDKVNDPANPFGNHASISEKPSIQDQPNDPANPFGNHAETSRQLTNVSPEPEVVPPAPLRIRTPTPDGRTAAEAGALAAGTVATKGRDAPKPLNLSPNRSASPAINGHMDGGMPSPAGTEFSMTPASPGSYANGQPPSNVHRIQLDFKPSMDDELSLRAGQLVRLLHEYDDGWALCIRLDRSQQGVAPRTCLSARPVKPRPPPGARGPPPRGPPPPGTFPRPSSPASGRGSPSPFDQGPRAQSPSPARGQRSMSPGPYGGGPQRPTIPTPGKRRSNSASAVRERRNSPPGPSPMNPNVQRVPMQLQAVTAPGQVLAQSPPTSVPRKPVPGQAM